jgi:mercuric reductase
MQPAEAPREGEEERDGAHLLIVGGGSAAFSGALRAAELGARATIINAGLPIGGTCVNVGCVPSKTLVRAAESLHRARHPRFAGIRGEGQLESFRTVIEEKRALVQGLRQSKYTDVVEDLESVRVLEGRARFLSPTRVSIGGQELEGDRVLIATGAAPALPPLRGLSEVRYLTNESAYELEELPGSLLVLGGRYIALETAQMFARLGSRVTVLQRSSRILPTETPDITEALTGYFRDEGIEVVTDVAAEEVRRVGHGVQLRAMVRGRAETFEGSHLLVATGREPNTRDLALDAVGVALDARGFVVVDETLETAVRGVYAAGDVIGEPMYVYTAAYEGALAAENALGGARRERDYTALPWVIFTDPQVAGVGLDERQAAEAGYLFEVARLPLSHVPRAIAARDTRGFIKLIRERDTKRLLGARILAPEGSELVMELALAIKYLISTQELGALFHPYLTLGEGVKLAAVAFEKDVARLSCCAS